jgi:tetratricopeptide (TPR) repeat protein
MTALQKLRLGFAALLFAAAAVPVWLWLVHLSSPVEAVLWSEKLGELARTAVWVAIGVTTGALAVWPPFLPAVRLALTTLRGRASVDQAPLHQALDRLSHFENAEDHAQVAQTALAMGDARRAVTHAARAVALDPSLLKARHTLARACAQLGDFGNAAQQFGALLERDPAYGFGDALLGLGRALEKLGRDDEARAILERHEQSYGADREALLVRARIAKRQGDRAGQRALLRRAAAPPRAGERLTPTAAFARARARVSAWTAGRD